LKYSEEMITAMDERAYLKKDVSGTPRSNSAGTKYVNQTDLQDCAQTYVDVAKNSSLTGQRIQIGE
jgi:hypothetical protein